jgi:hypothetical protein
MTIGPLTITIATILDLLWMLPALITIPKLYRLNRLAKRAYMDRLLGPPSPTKSAELTDLRAYWRRQRWRWTGIAATLSVGTVALLGLGADPIAGFILLVLLMYFPYRLLFEVMSDLHGDEGAIRQIRERKTGDTE